MPPKTALIERRSKDYICRSCLLGLRRQPSAHPPWSIRQASQTAAAARPAAPHRNKVQRVDDAERLKTLKKLGLLRRTKEEEEEEVTVNYFQEEGGKLRRLSNVDEFNEALNDPGGQMESDLEALEKDAKRVKDYYDLLVKAEIETQTSNPDVIRSEVKKLLESETPLSTTALDALNDLSQVLESEPNGPIRIGTRTLGIKDWAPHQSKKIVRLNNNLQLAARQLDRGKLDKQGFQVWKYYYGVRRDLSTRWNVVPKAVWALLWDIFAIESPKNPNRWHHVHVLAKDMTEAGVELSPKQQLLAIEATFLEGWHKEAVDNHKRNASTLGADPETFLDFWQLGFRMYCHTGDLERAERLLDVIVESNYEHDTRFMLPLVRAYAQQPGSVEKAYDLYHFIRTKLGDAMTIEDYDVIISYFLAARQSEKALWVFVEMMTSGRIQLRDSNKLPPSVANEFFVGKWLKRLMLVGDYEGAYNALLHMKDQGVMPRPLVLNVLIGSWLRTGVAANVQRAEDIAWTMINSRLQFVKLRSELRVRAQPAVQMKYHQSGVGWPKATLETFSLLAENYKDRGVLAKTEELWDAFKKAEVGPDGFFMNQLLFSLLRNGRGKEVHNLYRAMTQQFKHNNLRPDSKTFLALWQALPPNRLQHWKPEEVSEHVRASRSLFAEMVSFASSLQADKKTVTFQLARTIMHTFRRLEDPISMLVAYRALRLVFNLQDPGSMLLEMVVGTTDIEKASGNRKMRNKIITATEHTEHFLSQRQQEMVAAGQLGKDEEMPPDVRSAEMADFLEMHLEAGLQKMANSEELFKQAASEMGVYDPDADDVD
ncbi:pentatricopeptide repeat domain-containing protein [Seiridium cupressi]